MKTSVKLLKRIVSNHPISELVIDELFQHNQVGGRYVQF